MYVVYVFLDELAAGIVLAPVFWILGKFYFRSWQKTLGYGVFALYLAAVYFLVGLPTVQFLRFDVNLNLIPFAGMLADGKNTLLNVALFVPLGVLLPMLWSHYRRGSRVLVFSLGMTCAIELTQLLTFRATDINDVIANTLGGMVGWGVYRLLPVLHRCTPVGTKRDLPVLFAAVGGCMFFFQPYLVNLFYRWSC